MKQLRLIVAPVVYEQIREQVIYIAGDSIDHALAWEGRLRKSIQDLDDFHGYAIDEEASDRVGYAVRKLLFEKNYLIHFVIDEAHGVVRVVNFRHVARLPQQNEP